MSRPIYRLPLLTLSLLLLILLASPLLQAQTEEAKRPADTQESYVLTLTLKITDQAKVTTNQVYTLTAVNALHLGNGLPSFSDGGKEFSSPSVRDGDKVPIVASTDGDKTQIQYIDTGTNIDIENLIKIGPLLAMHIKIENSTALPNPASKDEPIIRQTRYSIGPAVTIGKLSTIYSSTDAVDGHRVEILLLAKPLETK